MQKPLISNRLLNRKWRDQELIDLNVKVNTMKPLIKTECPESFSYRKEHYVEQVVNPRQLEIARRNKILVEKICNLYSSAKPPKQEEIKIGISTTRKQRIQRISQENLEFSKRLIEKKPCLNRKKWDTDYKLSNYYMSNICEYPSVDFGKKAGGFENESTMTNVSSNMRSSSNGFNGTQLSMNITRFNKTSKGKFVVFTKLVDEYLNHLEDDYGVKTSLYYKKTILDEIDECYCKCYIENKKFVISVAPVISSYHTTHFLIFEDYEEILKLSKDFLSYEEILKNLEFRDTSLHLKQKSDIIKYRINKIETRIKLRENVEEIDCSIPSKRHKEQDKISENDEAEINAEKEEDALEIENKEREDFNKLLENYDIKDKNIENIENNEDELDVKQIENYMQSADFKNKSMEYDQKLKEMESKSNEYEQKLKEMENEVEDSITNKKIEEVNEENYTKNTKENLKDSIKEDNNDYENNNFDKIEEEDNNKDNNNNNKEENSKENEDQVKNENSKVEEIEDNNYDDANKLKNSKIVEENNIEDVNYDDNFDNNNDNDIKDDYAEDKNNADKDLKENNNDDNNDENNYDENNKEGNIEDNKEKSKNIDNEDNIDNAVDNFGDIEEVNNDYVDNKFE